MEIYETEEDAAGLYITRPLISSRSSHLFRHPLVYQVNPECGSFKIDDEMRQSNPALYTTSKKCLTELFQYLRSNMEIGEELELYSCWAQDRERFLEAPLKELELTIELSAFQLSDEFEWRERQYILVKK